MITDELCGLGEEVVVAYFEALPRHSKLGKI